jgi:hypothetical protein
MCEFAIEKTASLPFWSLANLSLKREIWGTKNSPNLTSTILV